jgi:CheY-like chemotaxis protein/nitrogen-specific signal transduction histidine kinase
MVLCAVLAIGLLVVLWRLRRLNRARVSAQAANSAKSQFVANVSHELRTPLNAILGMTELLAETGLDEAQRGMLDIVRGSAESLLALVNGVLDFAALEAGQVRLERTPFPLRSCVSTVLGTVRPQSTAKGLLLEVSIADDVPSQIVGDPLRLHQVLFTLLGNAVKFTEAGKVRLEVSVACGATQTQALLFRVVDTGIGISPEARARLFTPFTQGDAASTRRYEGTGLGLATVRRLVQLMQGSVGVESQPDRGSVFWFLLPLQTGETAESAPAQEGEPANPAVVPDKPHRGRILIVDDNPINRQIAQRALERLGYSAALASGGQQALAILQREAPPEASFDAILLDCQMPEMDGYQTAAAVRRCENGCARIPIIAFTAHSSAEDREKCLAHGMDEYLGKPLVLTTLENTLERCMATRAARPSFYGLATHPPACPKPPDPPNGRLPIPPPSLRLPS